MVARAAGAAATAAPREGVVAVVAGVVVGVVAGAVVAGAVVAGAVVVGVVAAGVMVAAAPRDGDGLCAGAAVAGLDTGAAASLVVVGAPDVAASHPVPAIMAVALAAPARRRARRAGCRRAVERGSMAPWSRPRLSGAWEPPPGSP